MSNIIAIVGRPNVGKSTLFNRIIKNRLSIVENKSGITRDRIYANAEWLTKKFILIDTGGLTTEKKIPFREEIKIQTQIAIKEADIIVFVLSYKEGITDDDKRIAKLLYKSNKKIILAINKYDQQNNNNDAYDYMKLGFGMGILISAEHGIGVGDLLDKIISFQDNEAKLKENNAISFSIVGKPNTGKSSLVNSILKEKRLIVSPVPGTTVDSVDVVFSFNKKKFIAIDTAGIRKKSKIFDKIEKYSLIRSLKSINRSDIVLLLIDCSIEITDLDTNIGGIAFAENKPVIIVLNKTDLLEKENKDKTYKILEQKIRNHFKYLNYSFIVFISALKNQKINDLISKINLVYELMDKKIKTSILNEVLVKAQLLNPSPNFNGGRLKIFYSTQPETKPPTFVLFVNNKKFLHFSYYRFIENQIRENFNFIGVPIKLIFRNKNKGD